MTEWKFIEYQELSSTERSAFSMGPFGSKITKENYVESGVPVVRGINLARGIFVDEGFVYITAQKADELISANMAPGDVVFTHRGTIGQVSMIPRSPRFARYVIGSSQVKTRLDESRVVPEFYYYWFQSAEGQRSILANASTVGVPGIATPLTSIRQLRVPYPSLQEQRAISTVLGALDEKIAVNDRIAATALELASAHYSHAQSSADWRTVSLGNAARWMSGGTPKTSEASYWGGDIPWISALSLKSPWVDDSDRKLTEAGVNAGTRLVPAGTMIFVVRGSSLKSEFRIGITQRRVAFGQDCKALIAAENIDPHMLFHGTRFRTAEILEMVDETSIGAGRLSTDLISKLEIRVPSQLENETAKLLRALDERATHCQRESRALANLRDTILPELMSGRLQVQGAERIVEDAV